MAEPIRLQGARLDEDFRPSYRPERPKGGGFNPEQWRIGLLAGGIGAFLALLVGASTLLRHTHTGVPVVEAEPWAVREKPKDPGGMTVTGADMGGVDAAGPQLAPAAEKPEIAALKAKLLQVRRAQARQAAELAQAQKMARLAEAARRAPVPGAPVPVPPVQQASATARISLPAPVAVATPATVPLPARITAPVPASGTQVQLAAFSDAAAAHTAWDALAKQAPDLLHGHKPDITRVDAAGRTMWRLRTGGFGTVAEATSFCGRIRARGGSCSIAAF